MYQNLFGVKAVVIPPLIDRTLYEADCIGADCVTFVNPHPDKGAVLATEIAARCPDITFEFVESWMLDPATRRWLFRRLSELPNVRLTPRQSDMRPIYGGPVFCLHPVNVRRAGDAWRQKLTSAGFPSSDRGSAA